MAFCPPYSIMNLSWTSIEKTGRGNAGGSHSVALVDVGRQEEVAGTAIVASLLQKRRRSTLGVQLDDKRKEMLKRHPLSVTVDLKCKGKRVTD